MHNVRRTVLSEEQKEAKAAERRKKLERFVQVRDVILKKTEKGIFDEEGLKMTALVLVKNPDFYIFWNYRKRTILAMIDSSTTTKEKTTTTTTAAEETNPDDDVDVAKQDGGDTSEMDNDGKKLENLYHSELQLTEECIREQPKSYAAWYHRQWILQKYYQVSSRAADLMKSEKTHCANALKADERNFHCWDHRRFVCRLASVSEATELEFSKEKIDENFSNYSAWHYRSSLLPQLFPPASDDSVLRLDESKLQEELTYAQNAFFTDPEDQSAWFYHYWLFRPMEKETERLALRYFFLSASSPATVVVSFNHAVKMENPSTFVKFLVDGVDIFESGWTNPDGYRRSCPIWIKSLTPDDSDKLTAAKFMRIVLRGEPVRDVELGAFGAHHPSLEYFLPSDPIDRIVSALQPTLPPAFRRALEESMGSCGELKSLVEPTSNKWPSFTEILSMATLDLSKYQSQIQDGLNVLMDVDPRKRNYYADLKSKYLIEARLLKHAAETGSIRQLDLANSQLTSLPSLSTVMLMIGISELNLSANRLTSIGSLGYLVSLRRLSLDGNRLTDTKGFGGLVRLEYLSLASNRLESLADLAPLKRCISLREWILADNPIGEKENVESILGFLGIRGLSVIL